MLVPPGDSQALSSALGDLLAQPERRAEMGRAGTTEVRRFARARVAAHILHAYHDAIASAINQPQPRHAFRPPRAAAAHLAAGAE